MYMAAGVGLGALSSYMGASSREQAISAYEQQLKALAGRYLPYEQHGTQAMDAAQAVARGQMAHPAGLETRLAASYQISPYQTQMLRNIRDQMNTNAAQTGMLGSTAQQANLQNALATHQNQWEQQYINRGVHQYGMGFGAQNSLASQLGRQGFSALGDDVQLRAKADMAGLQSGLMGSGLSNAISGGLGAYEGMMGGGKSL